ncbi:MAG: hypothetical protein LUE92_02245 [Clostridiales bacterium]|nr:hypothetical protein [Clostridiales bacterium]
MKGLFEVENLKRRLEMCVLGVVICAISIGFFKRAAFGIDPFQSLMAGVYRIIPISFGTLYVIVNILLLLFSLIVDRKYIGIATVINLFLCGYIADFTQTILYRVLPDLGIPGRVVCLLIGIVVMCLASAFYFTADLGVSPYDTVALIITGTWHKGQFRWVRILTDVICVFLGAGLFFLSGAGMAEVLASIGIGTIVTAFFMGPLIDFFNRKIAKPFLEKETGTRQGRIGYVSFASHLHR